MQHLEPSGQQRQAVWRFAHFSNAGTGRSPFWSARSRRPPGAERLAGYAEELRENGIAIDPALIAYGNFKQNDGYRCMKQLLAKRHTHPFSAVYVTSEMMTAGALQAIREAALQIGRDISLIGFDVHDELGLTTPKITTIRQPEMEIGVQTGSCCCSCSIRQNTARRIQHRF